jgi:hypothetical protein
MSAWMLPLRWIFVPESWAQADQVSPRRTFAAVGAVALASALALAGLRGAQARTAFQQAVAGYDQRHPQVVIEHGEVRTAGDAPLQVGDASFTLLVDPAEQVSLDTLTAVEWVAVRKTEIIRRDPFQRQTLPVADLQRALGDAPVVIDQASLTAWDARSGALVFYGLPFAFALLWAPISLLGAGLQAWFAGNAIHALADEARERTAERYRRMALAAATPTFPIATALLAVGWWPGPCIGLPLWTTWLVVAVFASLWLNDPAEDPQ